jgi:hypothetical protein
VGGSRVGLTLVVAGVEGVDPLAGGQPFSVDADLLRVLVVMLCLL